MLARSQYPESPTTGHLGTGFSWFPCVYKRMLRWLPRLQVAPACFSCSPTDLNFLDPYFIFMYTHYNHCHRATAHLQLNILLLLLLLLLFSNRVLCCVMCLMLNHFFSLRPSLTENTVSVVKTVSSASTINSQRPKLGSNRRHGNQSVAVTHTNYTRWIRHWKYASCLITVRSLGCAK